MLGGETVRHRNAASKPFVQKHTGTDGDTSRENKSTSTWVVVGWTAVGLILILAYANYSSPIAAKPIKKSRNSEAMEWADVENYDLKKGVRLLHDLQAPETAVVDNVTASIYVGTLDGQIARINNLGKSSQSVADVLSELKNGPYTAGGANVLRRPLGLRLKDQQLYVADAYQGIFVIDLNGKKWKKILGYNDISPELKFADDLVLNREVTKLYFTDMSEKWSYHELPLSCVEGDCSGRVIEVDLTSKATRTLYSNLCFPTGIELNPEETLLLVTESQGNGVVLLEKETGRMIREIPMPGGADNVRRSRYGGYWVPIATPPMEFLQITRNLPAVRNIAARVLGAKFLSVLAKFKMGMIVKLDDDFQPVSVYRDSNGELSRSITHVAELEEGFLLCSFRADGLVKIDHLPSRRNIRSATEE